MKVFLQKEQIDLLVTHLAKEIAGSSLKRPILLVGILDGAMPLLIDLSRALSDLEAEVIIETVSYKSYPSKKKSSEGVWKKSLYKKYPGWDIIIVDDINDTGDTIEQVSLGVLATTGCSSVRSCVLLQRDSTKRPATFVGVTVGDEEWFIGYGMDDADGTKRNLKSIYTK